MTSDDLQSEQALQVMATVRRRLQYLNRLVERMQALRFPPHDPMLRAALRAQDAMQELHVAAHYASCKSGVGKVASK